MKNYRIAAIPGDGIGNEVLPEGIRVLEAAGKRFGLAFTFDHFDWSCEHYAKHGRMMPEGGLDLIRKARCDFSRRRRLSRRARSCVAVGIADSDPARLQSIRQSASLPRAPRHEESTRRARSRRTSTSMSCAKTWKANIPKSAAACSAAPSMKRRCRNRSSPRRGTDRVMRWRLRARAQAGEEACDVCHQIERHRSHHAVLGRTLRGDEGELSRHPR